jgi:MFS family permease
LKTPAAPLPRLWWIYWGSNFISQIGAWMQSTAQAWLVLDLTGSPAMLGVLLALQNLPAVLLALPAATLADRYGRRNILLCAQIAMAALAVLVAALIASGNLSFPLLLGAAFLSGVANAVSQPARIALAATLAGPGGYSRTAGLATLSFNLARIIGPCLGGLAMAGLGVATAFAANAASFLPLLLVLASRLTDGAAANRPRAAIRDAAGFLWRNDRTRMPLLAVWAAGVLAINVQALVPAYARFALGLDAAGLGLLMGAIGAGACLGGFLQWRWPAGSAARTFAAAAGLGACLLGLAAPPHMASSLALLTAFGLCSATVLSSTAAAVQTAVPDHLRTAASALQILIILGSNPIGGLLTGWAVDQLGPAEGAGSLGAATLFAIALLWLLRSCPGSPVMPRLSDITKEI